jgi:hypothetical protein
MSFVFYSQMLSGGGIVIVRSVLEVPSWLWGTLVTLPEYPKTTPRYPVLVFDGFVTNFLQTQRDVLYEISDLCWVKRKTIKNKPKRHKYVYESNEIVK